jgi:hypothetical protein
LRERALEPELVLRAREPPRELVLRERALELELRPLRLEGPLFELDFLDFRVAIAPLERNVRAGACSPN